MSQQDDAKLVQQYQTICAGLFKQLGVPEDGRAVSFDKVPALVLSRLGQPVYVLVLPAAHAEVLETSLLETKFDCLHTQKG